MSADHLRIPSVIQPRRPGRRLLLGVVSLLTLAVLSGVVRLLQKSDSLTAAPPALFPGAIRTEDLGPDLTAYTTTATYQQVVAHYDQGIVARGTNVGISRNLLFGGEVDRLFLTPVPADRQMDEALFIHRAHRLTTWTLIVRGRQASVTRIVTGRRVDAHPANVSMSTNPAVLDDWGHPPWGRRGLALVGGIAAGTCVISAPFVENWLSHASMATIARPYTPGLTSANTPPASANGGARPAVYWMGDESDHLRLAVFERFEPGWCSLAILCAGPKDKITRLYLVTLLN